MSVFATRHCLYANVCWYFRVCRLFVFFFFNIPLLEMLQARICLQHLSSKKWKWNFIISVCEIVHDSHQHAAIEKASWFTSIHCHRKYVFSQNCYFGLFDNVLPHIFRAVWPLMVLVCWYVILRWIVHRWMYWSNRGLLMPPFCSHKQTTHLLPMCSWALHVGRQAP